MTFTIKVQRFEGPLDLLLDLIEKRKFYINDVSLARVTDEFIEHTKRFDQLPMQESANFVLIASTLLLIKSKSLLPELTISEEEKGDMEDLEKRLKILKKIREASINVQKLFGNEIIFPPSQARHCDPVFNPDKSFDLKKALVLLQDLIKRLPKKENIPKAVVQKVISLEEMIGNLTMRITSHLRMSFREFTKEHKDNRVGIVVSFLAMLELVKQGVIHVAQESTFGDISMETKEIGVPRY